MMRYLLIAGAAVGAVMGCATFATAATVTDGTLVQSVSGANDPFPNDYRQSPSLYKCDDIPDSKSVASKDDVVCTDEAGTAVGNYADAFEIVFTHFKEEDGEFEAVGGTWTFTPSAGLLFPHYMALKTGAGYEVWDISGLLTGFWTTEGGLENKGISHISFWNTGDTPVIPLPAAGWLLLAGVGGLVAMRRKKAA
jgi:hypothetical protein